MGSFRFLFYVSLNLGRFLRLKEEPAEEPMELFHPKNIVTRGFDILNNGVKYSFSTGKFKVCERMRKGMRQNINDLADPWLYNSVIPSLVNCLHM